MKYYYLSLFLLTFILPIACFAQNKHTSYTFDKQATFPGSNGDFVTYIATHVQKPNPITADVNGRLTFKIQIDEMGRASILDTLEKLSPEIDDAFAKAILAAPLWTAASLKGKAVKYLQMAYFYVTASKRSSAITVDALNAQPKEVDTTKIYNAVQVQPSFPGGTKAYDDFLRKTMIYPSAARANNVSGRVFAQFVVETDGSLSDIKVLRDPGSGLGTEAVRILKLTPKWTPGMQNGKLVRVQFTVPVNFSLY